MGSGIVSNRRATKQFGFQFPYPGKGEYYFTGEYLMYGLLIYTFLSRHECQAAGEC